jgi:SAM-dependent methyltransferase
VAFDVSGDAYDRFMGRYSRSLAPLFADFAGVGEGQRVLDVGAGAGALTGELARRVGPENVAAVEPSAQFVATLRERLPGVDVAHGPGEELPYEDGTFDVALAQLVAAFFRDAPTATREMRRVVRARGVVATCMWDGRGGMQLLSLFWNAVRDLDGTVVEDENRMRYRTAEELEELWRGAGLDDIELEPLEVSAGYEDFGEFWEALQLRVGPVGVYLGKLDERTRERLRDRLRERLGDPDGAFTLSGRAWAIRGRP